MAKKRSYGDGSWKTRTRKDGSTYLEFRDVVGMSLDGIPIRKSFYGNTQKECRAKRDAYKAALESKKIMIEEYTLAKWLIYAMETYRKSHVTPGTYESYLYDIKVIQDHSIADKLLLDIKPIHIAEFYDSCMKYSDSSMKRISGFLNFAFETAVDNDLCTRNPMRNVKKPAFRKRREKRAYNDSEIKIITDFAKTDPYGPAIMIMLGAGLRSGEMRALEWKHIDVDNRIIYVEQAITSDETLGPPKNGEAGCVPIRQDLANYLRKAMAAHSRDKANGVIRLKSKKEHDFVLAEKASGSYITDNAQVHRHYDFFKRLNAFRSTNGLDPIEALSRHELRHTYASYLNRKGVQLKNIQKLTRHKDIQTTANIYTHVDVNALLDVIDKI